MTLRGYATTIISQI